MEMWSLLIQKAHGKACKTTSLTDFNFAFGYLTAHRMVNADVLRDNVVGHQVCTAKEILTKLIYAMFGKTNTMMNRSNKAKRQIDH